MIRQVGTLVQLSTTIRDLTGTAVNTPTVTLSLTDPAGTVTSPAVTNTGSGGIYTATVTPTLAGLYLFTWTAAGTVVATSSDQFTAVAAQRALVASMQEFKAHLNRSDVVDDAELYTYLVTATDWVEVSIGGPLSVQTFTEKIWCAGWRIVPLKRPIVSVTSLTPELGGSAIDTTSLTIDTDHHVIRNYTGFVYGGWYTLVYRAGLGSIPERVKLAGLIVAAHLWTVQNGSGGRSFPGADDVVMTGAGYAVPRRAQELLAHDLAPGFA